MAAFGCFAGLATAGVGALCGYEEDALKMFDFPQSLASSSSSSRHVANHEQQVRSDSKIEGQKQTSRNSCNGSDWFDSPLYPCSP